MSVLCFGSEGAAEFQETFTKGIRVKRGGLSITVDVRVSNADLCSVNANAHPEVFVDARFRKQARARVSLHCPTGCVLEQPDS